MAEQTLTGTAGKIRSPLIWVGGKYRLAKTIIALFPQHDSYIEPFGGAAHVLLQKPPSTCETYNDINGDLVNFFRVVQQPDKWRQLATLLYDTLYSRQEWKEAKEHLQGDNLTNIERAYYFALVNRQSFAGNMTSGWGFSKGSKPGKLRAFSKIPILLQNCYDRLKCVQIENKNFDDIIRAYDNKNALFYLDPPYPFTENRCKTKVYSHEMTNRDHQYLVDLLLHLQGKAILSGFDTELYKPLEQAGWRKIHIGNTHVSTVNKRIDKMPLKDEFVWCNF